MPRAKAAKAPAAAQASPKPRLALLLVLLPLLLLPVPSVTVLVLPTLVLLVHVFDLVVLPRVGVCWQARRHGEVFVHRKQVKRPRKVGVIVLVAAFPSSDMDTSSITQVAPTLGALADALDSVPEGHE